MQPPSGPPADSPQNAEAAPQAINGDADERMALGRVAHAFREYRMDAEWEISRWEYNYGRLSAEHRALVPNLPHKVAAARQCAYQNHLFFKCLLDAYAAGEEGGMPPHLAAACAAAEEYAAAHGGRVAPQDADKVRYVLKDLMRDWSEEGAAERAESYGRILEELQHLFAEWPAGHDPPLVLVPGAGLGRLCLEISRLGYAAQGNEFSYFMLLTSSFVLNCTERAGQFTLHPWMHSCCNQLSDADQMRGVPVPDVLPADMVAGPGLLSMCAGDFVDVYRQVEYEGAFDAVATCFFIDTAHNVMEYLETIWAVLRPGGCWVNLGPLLYHWADSLADASSSPELSIELSLEDVEQIALQLGFEQLRRELVPASYMANQRGMLRSTYHAAFWTMRKPAAPDGAAG